MSTNIQIVEKPDWVSWEDIKQCLEYAHSVNRAKGINMTHYKWPVEKIRDYIGPNGVMLVALDGEKVVGTAAIAEIYRDTWYVKGRCAYKCFGGILPEYSGQGIFKNMDRIRDELCLSHNYSVSVFDTHVNNNRRIRIAKAIGYRKVGYFRVSNNDHFNVVMAKWLTGCPYSKVYCNFRFYLSWFRANLSVVYHAIKNSLTIH